MTGVGRGPEGEAPPPTLHHGPVQPIRFLVTGILGSPPEQEAWGQQCQERQPQAARVFPWVVVRHECVKVAQTCAQEPRGCGRPSVRVVGRKAVGSRLQPPTVADSFQVLFHLTSASPSYSDAVFIQHSHVGGIGGGSKIAHNLFAQTHCLFVCFITFLLMFVGQAYVFVPSVEILVHVHFLHFFLLCMCSLNTVLYCDALGIIWH